MTLRDVPAMEHLEMIRLGPIWRDEAKRVMRTPALWRRAQEPNAAGRGAKRPQRTFAGVEKTRVTHGVPDSLRPSNDLGITARRFDNAEHPGVENTHDLGQSRKQRNFADAENEFIEHIIDPAPTSFGLAFYVLGADARDFPDGCAFDALSVFEQIRKHVAQHVRTCRRQKPQGAPIVFGLGIDGHKVQWIGVIELISLVAVPDDDVPSKSS